MDKKAKEIFMFALAGLVVLGFFAILFVVFMVQMPSPNKELGLLVIGALVSKFGDVIGYFFGSSKGSSDKTEMLGKK